MHYMYLSLYIWCVSPSVLANPTTTTITNITNITINHTTITAIRDESAGAVQPGRGGRN